jgi:hypothetical protein
MTTKNKVKWSKTPKDDSLENPYDLCGKDKNDKYVDVTHSFKGTWSVLYNNVRLKDDFVSRDEAKDWAEKTDLINFLSEMS